MVAYGLKHTETGNLVGFDTNATDGEFCVDVSFQLDKDSDNLWVVMDRTVAENVCYGESPAWYNQSFTSPGNPYVGKLEVVELVVKVGE